MKYMHHNMIVMLTIFLFIAACSNGERIKDIYDVRQMILRNILGHTLVIIQMWLQLLIIYPVVKQFKV